MPPPHYLGNTTMYKSPLEEVALVCELPDIKKVLDSLNISIISTDNSVVLCVPSLVSDDIQVYFAALILEDNRFRVVEEVVGGSELSNTLCEVGSPDEAAIRLIMFALEYYMSTTSVLSLSSLRGDQE